MNIKKYKIGIHSSEIADLIDSLPKGMRTPVIESALTMYMRSNDGKAFLKHFISEGSKGYADNIKPAPAKPGLKNKPAGIRVQKKIHQKKNKSFVSKFKGDFT